MTEQERQAMVRDFIMAIVGVWVRWMRSPFDEVFYMSGLRVRIQISEFKRPDDTKPINRADDLREGLGVEDLYPDQSIDS